MSIVTERCRPMIDQLPDTPSPPFARTYWVIPGRFLAGVYPGSQSPQEALAKLSGLNQVGVEVVINLMEGHEVNFAGQSFVPYASQLAQLARKNGRKVEVLTYPMRDNSVPERDAMVALLDHIDRVMDGDKVLYLHCWGGRGRTGTVVGCYLMRHGMADPGSVLSEVERLRGEGFGMLGASPETSEHCRFVLEWSRGE